MGGGLWGALGGGLLGAVQYGSKKRQHEHDKQVAAETARYSPWTGLKPIDPGADPSLIGMVGQGALGGASFGQQFGGGGDAAAAPQAAPQSQAEYAAASPFSNGPRLQQGNPWALPNPYAPPGFGP